MATKPTRSPAIAAAVTRLLAREAAVLARVTPETIREWIRRGTLPAARVPGGYRIDRADLDALLSRRAVESPPPELRPLGRPDGKGGV